MHFWWAGVCFVWKVFYSGKQVFDALDKNIIIIIIVYEWI